MKNADNCKKFILIILKLDMAGRDNTPNAVGQPIFISFSFKNKTEVDNIVKKIELALGRGTCWICTSGIQPGEVMDTKIANALAKAPVVVCMISQDYIDSKECEKEVLLAVEYKKEMIAAHVESVRTPYKCKDGSVSAVQLTFARRLRLNLTGVDMKNDLKRLIVRIEQLISREDNQFTEFAKNILPS